MVISACLIASCDNAPYLAQAIASVRAQTRPFDVILVADDASTDGSREVIRSLAAEEPRLLPVLRDRRLGPAGNRDLAIRDMRADWITQLDGDDAMTPDKHAAEWEAVTSFQGRTEAVGFSDVLLVDAWGDPLESWNLGRYALMDRAERLAWMARRSAPIPRDMLLSRHLYLEAGGYDHALPLYEDWDFKLRLAACRAVWRHSGITGTQYRRHGAGLSEAPLAEHEHWLATVRQRNAALLAGAE
ncbi:glycosyltransferase [Falsiroseomonas sp.]|uniref:glycosyltransferase family 2 protein n=1 Tax=Falsiroseomonas sp. TaxID=2870721 RepID=UPI002717734E|nr:glycosyltransferase [Falsiroseomonas sp.]MDO9500376.1 glycosyltransferase [Falsiroseomonas sp.]